jgi:tetratricopeptide (TPR) repeat protein
MTAPPSRRRKRKNRRSATQKYWWLPLILVGFLLILWIATGPRWSRAKVNLSPAARPIAGYNPNPAIVLEEYQHFYGKALANHEVEGLCARANERVAAKDYSNALGILEELAKVAAVPVVYNNLGVVYAEVNDRPRAMNAFREALARDMDYQPVRLNLDRLKDMALDAEPVSREAESNNNPSLANIIAPGKPVQGEIAAGVNDVDYFRVNTPPAPRDLVEIEIENRSTTLAPVLKLFDADQRATGMGMTERKPGASIRLTIAPTPNTTLYLEVSGYGSSAGAYTLRVTPKKAFDAYEPNDDIFNAKAITLGTPVTANIMDENDTDYFSLLSARTGTVKITITNNSATLIPALSTFFPDKRSSGFGPDIKIPGGSLSHTMDVLENQTYFLQVWSRFNSGGAYSLLVE